MLFVPSPFLTQVPLWKGLQKVSVIDRRRQCEMMTKQVFHQHVGYSGFIPQSMVLGILVVFKLIEYIDNLSIVATFQALDYEFP